MDRALQEIIEEDKKANRNNKKAKAYLYYYRKAQWYKGKSKIKYLWNKFWLLLKFKNTGVELKEIIPVGKGLRLPHLHGIIVSDYALIGDYCTIYHHVTIGANEHCREYKNAPKIGDRVYIGAGATLIGNIEVGDDVIIGANATVTKSVPNGMTVVGNNIFLQTAVERNPHPCLNIDLG
ncbi:MAG: serine acetyltransferase [Bacteroidales bacterium]|nr:serine acetyltransferase [Bacteroidales bacterium]